MGSYFLVGTEFLFGGDEKVLEIGSGDWWHDIVNVINAI